jgi:hypothetical protein
MTSAHRLVECRRCAVFPRLVLLAFVIVVIVVVKLELTQATLATSGSLRYVTVSVVRNHGL